MRHLTIAVASYQRRVQLQGLLGGLEAQLVADPSLREALEVTVVLDGSTDGSKEMVEGLRFPVPLRAIWQPNRGLAAARNAGLAAATDLVWFLDDDLIPAPGLVLRHRRAHEVGTDLILMGPCVVPPDWPIPPSTRHFWEQEYAALAVTGKVERFDQFSGANTSGPSGLFRSVGGFEESFVGYGLEDYELAIRLLRAGVAIHFDPEAVAWHHQHRRFSELLAFTVSEGRNAVTLAALHPELEEEIFSSEGSAFASRRLWRLHLRSPRRLRLASRLLGLPAVVEGRVTGGRIHRITDLARAAAYAAGVAEVDTEGRLLARLLQP